MVVCTPRGAALILWMRARLTQAGRASMLRDRGGALGSVPVGRGAPVLGTSGTTVGVGVAPLRPAAVPVRVGGSLPAVPPRGPARARAITADAPTPTPGAEPPPLQPVGSPGRHWQQLAAEHAGFDLTTWHPELGFAANRQFVWGGYEYYRRLQLAHPELLWAGMAYGIGPTFAAALEDLSVLNRYTRAFPAGGSQPPAPAAPTTTGMLAASTSSAPLADASLGATLLGVGTARRVARDLETELLRMQQAIFLDQGMQHEAWLGGGMPAIRELAASGAIDAHAVEAWRQLDEGARTGDRAELERGNLELLRREQLQTIAASYDHIRQLTAISPVVTWLLTAIGRPAIPGARTPGQVVPVHIGGVPLPIPAIDISRAADRWRVIERDTWPAFSRLVDERPAAYRSMLETPLDARIAEGKFRRLPDSASLKDVARFVWNVTRHHGSVAMPAPLVTG